MGPVLPYRGGIARYTTELARALATDRPAPVLSFRRLYPAAWYPGVSCLEPGFEHHVEPGAQAILDPLNPLAWRRGADWMAGQGVRHAALMWWTAFLAPCIGSVGRLLRRAGVEPIVICHNVEDHERALWKRALGLYVLTCSHRFVAHSKADAEAIARAFPAARVSVCPNPLPTSAPPPARILPRRARIEILFFGLVRPYKGLDVLAEAMERLGDADVFLTVAGEWWIRDTPLRARLEKLARVELIDRYVSDTEAADLLGRADAVVLPYRQASGTAVAPLAYRYGKPVIASRVGGLADMVAEGVSGFLVPPGDPAALAEAIRRLPGSFAPETVHAEGTRLLRTFDDLAPAVRALATA